jgi:broad specificity phosphatase PhoE
MKISAIWSSDLGRSKETAQLFQTALIDAGHNVPLIRYTKSLQSWNLGGHEGRKLDKKLQNEIYRLMREAPDEVPEGRGPKSTEDGESFNGFKTRVLSFVHDRVEAFDGKSIEIYFTHRYPVQLIKAHAGIGMPGDFAIDIDAMTRLDDTLDHDSIWRAWRSVTGDLRFHEIELKGCGKFPAGQFFLRHGQTAWN